MKTMTTTRAATTIIRMIAIAPTTPLAAVRLAPPAAAIKP